MDAVVAHDEVARADVEPDPAPRVVVELVALDDDVVGHGLEPAGLPARVEGLGAVVVDVVAGDARAAHADAELAAVRDLAVEQLAATRRARRSPPCASVRTLSRTTIACPSSWSAPDCESFVAWRMTTRSTVTPSARDDDPARPDAHLERVAGRVGPEHGPADPRRR